MIMSDEYMTVLNAAQFLRVHVNTLKKWERLGKLVPVRIGNLKWRLYKKDDLEKFKKERESRVTIF